MVLFGLCIMCQEGKFKVWIFGFFRSKSSNLKGWKISDMLGQISPYLRKCEYLVKEVYWWNVVHCTGVWLVGYYMVFRRGLSLDTNLRFLEGVQNRYLVEILASSVWNYVTSFNIQIFWVHFKSKNNTKHLLKFIIYTSACLWLCHLVWSMCVGYCI